MSFFAHSTFTLAHSSSSTTCRDSILPVRRRSPDRRTSPYSFPSLSPSADMSDQQASSSTLRPVRPKLTRPRPGLGRTTSFCPSAPGQGYATAAQSSTSAPPGRLSKPLLRSPVGTVLAPTMQRTLSSQGVDGYRLNRHVSNIKWQDGSPGTSSSISLPATPAVWKNDGQMVTSEVFESVQPERSIVPMLPIPTIVIDSPERPSLPVFSARSRKQDSPSPSPLYSTPTPGFERYSPSFSDCSTPGPSTPFMRPNGREVDIVQISRSVEKDVCVEQVSKGVEDLAVSRRASAVTI